MAFCSKCGANVADGAAFCPGCGAPASAATPGGAPAAQTSGIESNLAAAISYLWITAIFFLLVEPYNKDRFVRFHSFQSLFLGIVWIILSIVLGMIPILGWILLMFLPLLGLLIVIVCAVKAYNKEWFKLPLLGDFAEQQAGK